MTHICVSKLIIIGSDNGLSPGRRQAIIWTNAGILLNRTLGTNFSKILGEIHAFPFSKIHLKMSSAKWRLFGLSLNELMQHWKSFVVMNSYNPHVQYHWLRLRSNIVYVVLLWAVITYISWCLRLTNWFVWQKHNFLRTLIICGRLDTIYIDCLHSKRLFANTDFRCFQEYISISNVCSHAVLISRFHIGINSDLR